MAILFAGCPGLFAAENSGSTDTSWKLTVRDKDLEIYSRARAGSPHKEFKAVATIDAPTRALGAVIDDFENYPKFMPFTTECRLIKQDGDTMIGYQRLSPKICADRDYTLRVSKKAWPLPDGLLYTSRYSIYTDSGGAIPSFVGNHINVSGIRRLFVALRKQVKDPKYAAASTASSMPARP
ncbi:MAG: hypothetical protein DMF01_11060 [Verrucomicrobia bacterium]|nr:MAG: hypothetical protein DMF01_11060 [Verrucomicrobiota bacterium]